MLGSWTHEHVLPQQYQALKKITIYMIKKKSIFILWRLVIELSIELLKALHLPLKKTKQKKTIIRGPPPSSISLRLAFLVWGAGLMLALIFVIHGNEWMSCCGIRKCWPPTWTRPVLRLSLIHWLRVLNRFLFWGKFVRLTYLRTIMKMTTTNTKKQIYPPNRYRDQRNATVK